MWVLFFEISHAPPSFMQRSKVCVCIDCLFLFLFFFFFFKIWICCFLQCSVAFFASFQLPYICFSFFFYLPFSFFFFYFFVRFFGFVFLCCQWRRSSPFFFFFLLFLCTFLWLCFSLLSMTKKFSLFLFFFNNLRIPLCFLLSNGSFSALLSSLWDKLS